MTFGCIRPAAKNSWARKHCKIKARRVGRTRRAFVCLLLLMAACGNQTTATGIFFLIFGIVQRRNYGAFAGSGGMNKAALAEINANMRNASFVSIGEEN